MDGHGANINLAAGHANRSDHSATTHGKDSFISAETGCEFALSLHDAWELLRITTVHAERQHWLD